MEPLALVDIYQYNISHTVGVQLAAKTHIMLQSHMFKQRLEIVAWPNLQIEISLSQWLGYPICTLVWLTH